jgi:hypothetical protein
MTAVNPSGLLKNEQDAIQRLCERLIEKTGADGVLVVNRDAMEIARAGSLELPVELQRAAELGAKSFSGPLVTDTARTWRFQLIEHKPAWMVLVATWEIEPEARPGGAFVNAREELEELLARLLKAFR